MKDFRMKGIKLCRKDQPYMKECRKYKSCRGFKECIKMNFEDLDKKPICNKEDNNRKMTKRKKTRWN
jgi:hypothetical protein